MTVPGRDAFQFGAAGVPIFFVISGFVICASASGSTPMSFLRRRAERLYPCVFICAPITAAVWLLSGRGVIKTMLVLFKSMFLLPWGGWIDAPYWTLGCEVVFYAYVLATLLMYGERALKTAAQWLGVTCTIFTGVLICTAAAPDLNALARSLATHVLLPLYWGSHFALGMLLYILRRGNGSGVKVATIVTLAGACAQSAGLFDISEISPVFAAVWLSGVLCIVRCRGASKESHPIARWAGLTSYPLYLVHFALGLRLMVGLHNEGVSPLAALIAVAAVMVLLAFAVAKLAEPPLSRLFSLLLSRWGPSTCMTPS